jgi:outer membrane protein with glycine zipper
MRSFILAAALSTATLTACTTYGGYYDDYDYARAYRTSAYEPYSLGYNDVIYRGSDGRYYCRRHDGTVGLVVGAGVGALLGSAIAPRGSGTLGAILGATAGGAIGYSADRNLSCD